MANLKENSKDKEMLFLIEKIRNSEKDTEQIMAKTLLEQFNSFCIESNYEYSTTPNKFGCRISNYRMDGFTKVDRSQGKLYIFDIKKCVKWLITKGELPNDFNSLERAPESLLRPRLECELDEEEEEDDRKYLPKMR